MAKLVKIHERPTRVGKRLFIGHAPFNADPVMPKNVADSWSLFRTVSKEMTGTLSVLRLHAEFALTFPSFDYGGASSGFERGAAKQLRL
jgi:hypothetical protein